MERAGRSLAKLRLSGKIDTDELACAAWPAAVGKRLASHARAVALVRGNLIVEVEDAIWQQQLFFLRHQILGRIHQVIGESGVKEIEFRIATPRRPPRMETSFAASDDDADHIADPGLRIVYKQARKKAAG